MRMRLDGDGWRLGQVEDWFELGRGVERAKVGIYGLDFWVGVYAWLAGCFGGDDSALYRISILRLSMRVR